jgi:hypothetical protein
MPGALRTRSRACSVESTRVSHHGCAEITRHSRTRMVLTVSFVLSPVIGLSCHRRRRNCFRQLDAGVEASGPYDFAVRKLAHSSQTPPASIASLPALMTLRNAPLLGQDGASCRSDLPDARSKIFLRRALDRQICQGGADLPVGLRVRPGRIAQASADRQSRGQPAFPRLPLLTGHAADIQKSALMTQRRQSCRGWLL